MVFNVGLRDIKGYCFVDVDITIDEWENGNRQETHPKVIKAIKDKYNTNRIMGFAPNYN